jgi:hypothetical protein
MVLTRQGDGEPVAVGGARLWSRRLPATSLFECLRRTVGTVGRLLAQNFGAVDDFLSRDPHLSFPEGKNRSRQARHERSWDTSASSPAAILGARSRLRGRRSRPLGVSVPAGHLGGASPSKVVHAAYRPALAHVPLESRKSVCGEKLPQGRTFTERTVQLSNGRHNPFHPQGLPLGRLGDTGVFPPRSLASQRACTCRRPVASRCWGAGL